MKRISCSSRNCIDHCYYAVYKSDPANTRYTTDYRTSSLSQCHQYNNYNHQSYGNHYNNHKNPYILYDY